MIKWIVIGKRWFERVNGNTYHTVVIIDANTNKEILRSGFKYGYGDQYFWTAKHLLTQAGLMTEEDSHNHNFTHENMTLICNDVARKKDLDL